MSRFPTHAFQFLAAVVLIIVHAPAQSSTASGGLNSSWLMYQAVPGISWTSHPGGTNFALEWEAAPVLYSFGMTKLVSPWKFFFVRPPARFTGSLEFVVAGEVYTSRLNDSHVGFSTTLLGHVPLVEYGEYLALNLGAARHWFSDTPHDFVVVGLSTVFGFVEYNIRYAPRDKIWIHQIAARMF